MSLDQLALIEEKLQKRQKRFRRSLKRTSHQAKKFIDRKSLGASDLRQKSTQILASIGLTGTLLLNPGGPVRTALTTNQEVTQTMSASLSQSLAPVTPHSPTNLDEKTGDEISQVIKNQTGITAVASLEGQKLNHQVGYVGYEQHLRRFPGDDINLHDDEQIAGIAPGLGAWGYFAKSKNSFTTQDYQREKYYSVAQTLYLPNWNQDFRFLRDWYKHRKILIVNPKNGQAVVTVLADAGPADWTGKQFGASPEAMKELDLHKGPRKGLVLFLFVDDPNDLIPLGPVSKKLNIN